MSNINIIKPINWFLGLGAIGVFLNWAFSLVIYVATIFVWFTGVSYGFNHSILAEIVSLIPPIGFIEGLLHLLGLI